MFVSTEIGSLKKWGSNEEILKLLKETGFEAYDFSMFFSTTQNFIFDADYKEKAEALRFFADSISIKCNQTHAPFPVLCPNESDHANYIFSEIERATGKTFPASENQKEEYNGLMETLLKRAIEISAILGAKACVIHPCNNHDAEQNAALYQKYLPLAKSLGVKIATENMWNGKAGDFKKAACSHHEDFLRHLEKIKDDDFVACLDIGHAELIGLDTSAEQMIRTLKDRLYCLHVHDNDFLRDAHDLPFTASIDFEKVTDALAEIGYSGDITLETEGYFKGIDKKDLPSAVKKAFFVADELRKKVLSKSK